MKLKRKSDQSLAFGSTFNMCSLSEIIVSFVGGNSTSAFIKDFEVFLESSKVWKDMFNAFKDKDIITDNHNSIFFEPKNKEDRNRGYTL